MDWNQLDENTWQVGNSNFVLSRERGGWRITYLYRDEKDRLNGGSLLLEALTDMARMQDKRALYSN